MAANGIIDKICNGFPISYKKEEESELTIIPN